MLHKDRNGTTNGKKSQDRLTIFQISQTGFEIFAENVGGYTRSTMHPLQENIVLEITVL